MVEGISSRKKRYVKVIAETDEAGKVTPLAITWEDGRTFTVDQVLDARRAASLKVGGIGMRYLLRIQNNQTFLYYEDPQWFVEEKVGD